MDPGADVNSSPLVRRDDQEVESISSRVADFSKKKQTKANRKTKADEEDVSEIAFWSAAKKQSWAAIDTNPNAFYYRHVAPGQVKRTGAWTEEEKRLFMETIKVHPPSQGKWGLFAQHIPGRVGYQCRNFYHRLLESGELTALPGELERIQRKRKGGDSKKPKRQPKRRIETESDEPVNLESDGDDRDEEDETAPAPIEQPEVTIAPVAVTATLSVPKPREENPWTLPEQEIKQQQVEPVKATGVKWSPRMREPWKADINPDRDRVFPSSPIGTYDTSHFEYESSKILRLNSENPLLMMMLSFPVPAEKRRVYINAVRTHLANDSEPAKARLITECFRTMDEMGDLPPDQKGSAANRFIDMVIESSKM